jgi:Flp pilus assembly protein TadD
MGREPDLHLPHDVAREVCQRLNAKAMVEGRIGRLGEHYITSLAATACTSGETIGLEQSQAARKEEVLQGLGRAVKAMRSHLGESLSTIASFDVPIEQATTPSLDALKSYTLGQASRSEGRELQAVPFFERAVALDPQFASAWNALSTVYGNLGESDKAREYGARAFKESGQVSERERLAIAFQYHDRVTGNLDDAIASLELWKRLYPRDYRPPNSLAVLLNRAGDYERAVEEAREAQRRNPNHGFPFSNLAYALRGLNQFEESRAVAESAATRGIETVPTRRLLFQLAVARGDLQDAARHLAWARGRPREFDMVGAQAQVAAYEGRWSEARELYRRTADLARAARLQEVASSYTAQAAWAAALLGYPEEARALARPLIENSTPQVRLQLAAALAAASDTAGLALIVDGSIAARQEDTLLVNVTGPIAHAALHLAAGRAREAQAALRPTERYDLGRTAALAPLHLRAEALLAAGDGAGAAVEFKHLHDHRGSDPFSVFHALSTLGLARAQALAGDTVASRASYARFLTAFSRADPDLPIVARARAELQGLQRAG